MKFVACERIGVEFDPEKPSAVVLNALVEGTRFFGLLSWRRSVRVVLPLYAAQGLARDLESAANSGFARGGARRTK